MDIEQSDQLIKYLQVNGHLAIDETPQVTVLAGGVSNRTVLVEGARGGGMVIKQALKKLRVKEDWFSDPSRIHREAAGMRILQDIVPAGAVPALLFEDHEDLLLGMQAVPQPHTNWKQELLQGEIDHEVVEQFAACLGAIHRSFDLKKYPEDGILHQQDFFESLRVEPYYLFSALRVPDAAGFIHQLVADTRAIRQTLVHGDYSPKNILIHNGRLVLLDHEVIHVGDPAFDIGFSLTHLLSKAHHLVEKRGAFIDSAQLYWASYFKMIKEVDWIAGFEARAVQHTLGCLLARVAGRSPLEYLNDKEKALQQAIVLSLISAPPQHIPDMIVRFASYLPS